MNSFSNFGSMLGRGSQNVNSISYINRYAKKNIKFDFSGSEFSDLSYNPYAVTSAGLNMINGNTTIARLKLNNDYLKSTDFTSSSFTIYLKHAARYSNASPFNFAYPSAASVSNAVVLSGSDFSANFYSLLDPGTPLPYVFSGCTTTELNGTSLTGTVTAPYGTVTKTFTRANYAIFPTVVPQSLTISCVPLPVTRYAVTVSNNLFYINGSRPLPTMTAGNVYLFDQSNNSNIGNTLVFGPTLDSPSYYTTGVTTNGTAGSAGAYTLLNYTSATPSGLKYYSRQTAGMGYEPSYTATGTYSSTNVGTLYTVTFTQNSGSIRIISADATVSILVVGGGGGGGSSGYNSDYGGKGGGGGGIIYNPSYTIENGRTYDIIVGSGGSRGTYTPSGEAFNSSAVHTSGGNGSSSSFGGTIMIGSYGYGGNVGGASPETGGLGGDGLGSGSSYNGGTGSGHSYNGTTKSYISGGSGTQINSNNYSGGGKAGNIKGGVQSPYTNPYSNEWGTYGTGGQGGDGVASSNQQGDAGQRGVVIIKFTLL